MTETQLRLQIPVATYIYSAFVRCQIKENKKAERRTEKSSLQRKMEQKIGGRGRSV